MYKFRITKTKAYEVQGYLSGEFPEEALRLLNLVDGDDVHIVAEVGTEWDYDIPMTFIDGEVYAKDGDGNWVSAEAFLKATKTRYLVEDYVENMIDIYDGDYTADLIAARADFRMDLND